MVPELADLPVLEAKDVDAGEACSSPCRLDCAPASGVRPCGRLSCGDELVFGDHDLDVEVKVREGGAEVSGDSLHPLRAWECLGRPQVVTYVVVRKQLIDQLLLLLCFRASSPPRHHR